MKVLGVFERLLPGASDAPAAAGAAGGTGLLGLGGAKLAGLVAAGAVATAGSGLVVAHDRQGTPSATEHRSTVPGRAARVVAARSAPATPARAVALSRSDPSLHPTRSQPRTTARRLGVRRHPATARLEFAPAGADAPGPSAPAAPAVVTAAAVEPRIAPISNPTPADTVRGEFAPRP
jgi:hypothetical protein